MKNLLCFTFMFFHVLTAFSQDITGRWYGVLKVQGVELNLIFNIAKTETGYASTMDSPNQGAKDVPVPSTTFVDNVLKMEVPAEKIVYVGKFQKNEIIGEFKQRTAVLTLNLMRNAPKKAEIASGPKAQILSKPYPYIEENVSFENKSANIKLAGTLTLPSKKGKFPVAILISGSGPQDRNEEILGHKPFLILADELTKKGIAVLRFDDRGTAESTGDFMSATTADFATDVEAAIAYLRTRKDIDKKNIGLIGHSEGGLIAPMVAAKDKKINFIVLLAGTGIQGNELLLLQEALIAKDAGVGENEIEETRKSSKIAYDLVVNAKNDELLKVDLSKHIRKTLRENRESEKPEGMTEKELVDLQVEQLMMPWMQYFLKYNPVSTLEKVKCSVLALNGEYDLQVPAAINLEAIKAATTKGGNSNVTTVTLPKLNHLFQECTSGSPNEYANIKQTIAPLALETVSSWVLKTVK